MPTFTQAARNQARMWLSLVALSALPLGAVGCGEARAKAPEVEVERSVPVVVTRAQRGRLLRSVHAAGVLSAKRELDLSFKVPGVVQRVLVEEGAHVKRGQLLATLDPTEVQAGSEQASEAYVKAQRDAARARMLHEASSLPRASMEDAETALVLTRAAASSAAFNLRHSSLVAPDDGVVERRTLEAGEVVAPGRPVFHFKSGLGSVVKVGLVDRDVLTVSLGDRAEVELDAMAGHPFAARVTRVATSRTPTSGTYEVELALLDMRAALALPSGLTAKVSFVRDESALSLPLTALVEGDREHAAVFRLEQGKARRTPVRIDGIEGDRVMLAGGIDEAVQVVSTGAAELRDGARVRVVGEE
jgi:RND family efflux transporter MFP subunit